MMATRLMKHDLHEMMLEWPVQNLAGESRTERIVIGDNGYLKADIRRNMYSVFFDYGTSYIM